MRNERAVLAKLRRLAADPAAFPAERDVALQKADAIEAKLAAEVAPASEPTTTFWGVPLNLDPIVVSGEVAIYINGQRLQADDGIRVTFRYTSH